MDDTLILPPNPRVGALIQVRMGSTRLPGKALLPLPLHTPHKTVFQHIIERARRAAFVHTIVAATSNTSADDPIAQLASQLQTHVFRGDEQDVLGRFNEAALMHNLNVIVRLTGDNPAIDPFYIDRAVEFHLAQQADYTLTIGLPLGTNLEVISQKALAAVHAQATRPEEREHVTPYLRRNPGGQFCLQTLPLTVPAPLRGLRLTLDYPSDYALLHLLFSRLPDQFMLADVQELLLKYPWLPQINHQNEQLRP
jgi:spore coat polysaccharide biosynthesis protein SpsF